MSRTDPFPFSQLVPRLQFCETLLAFDKRAFDLDRTRVHAELEERADLVELHTRTRVSVTDLLVADLAELLEQLGLVLSEMLARPIDQHALEVIVRSGAILFQDPLV